MRAMSQMPQSLSSATTGSAQPVADRPPGGGPVSAGDTRWPQPQPWVQPLLASLGETWPPTAGPRGILREWAPVPLNGRTDVEAVVVSTENAFTQ